MQSRINMQTNSSVNNSPTTIDVGGAAFPLTKTISNDDEPLLIAKGKSCLSYFYVGVCSSVLYLPPDIEAVDNSIISQQQSNDAISSLSPIALEIYYHKPARAADLQWATNNFIEAN